MSETTDLTCGIVQIADTVIGIPIHHLSEVCHIEALSALPVESDLLLGGFELRDSIVPVLDFHKIAGLPKQETQQHLVAVLKDKDRLLAFYIDEVLGIAHAQSNKVQTLQGSDECESTCFQGIFSQEDQFISILDVAALCNTPGVYATTRSEIATQRERQTDNVPMLIFEAGEALFALPAVEVYAAVPRREILQTAINAGPCLGEITYYNRRIPVMCPVQVIGLGKSRPSTVSQVVVLGFPDDRLIGFAVDAVLTITSIQRERASRLPIWLSKDAFVGKVNIQDDGQQVYELDLEALRENPNLTAIASLSDQAPKNTDTKKLSRTAEAEANVVYERIKYLIVQAGGRLAIPLNEISCILELPEKLTPPASASRGFAGFFSRLNQSVALFDLPRMLGKPADQDEDSRVVLTGEKDNQIGFWVERVLGIEMSEWRETVRTSGQSQTEAQTIVKITAKDDNAVLPVVSLQKLIADAR